MKNVIPILLGYSLILVASETLANAVDAADRNVDRARAELQKAEKEETEAKDAVENTPQGTTDIVRRYMEAVDARDAAQDEVYRAEREAAESRAQEIDVCGWAKTLPQAYENSNEIIHWHSDADVEGAKGDIHNFTRFVINLDTRPRSIWWDAGYLIVDRLEPNFIAWHCQPGMMGRNEHSGPLYYARDATNIPTTAYYGLVERNELHRDVATKPVTLIAEVGASKLAPPYRPWVRFTALLRKGDPNFEFEHQTQNLSNRDIVVDFRFDPHLGSIESRLVIKSGQTEEAQFKSEVFPDLTYAVVSVSLVDGMETTLHTVIPWFRVSD